jgi:molybdate transport system substrate-binding protein
MPNTRLSGISSMATRHVLADLAHAWRQRSGVEASFESVGGVDAVRRVQAGEPFDLVVLAADAVDKLVASGHVRADSRTDLVHSGVSVAVRAGAPRPAIDSEQSLRDAVLAARSVGFSTGPSGVALAALFERWGIADALRARLVQAPPGVPVATLVASGEVELGFQQLSEMMGQPGIEVLGPMPGNIQIVTTFSAAQCSASMQPEAVAALLGFMHSSDAVQAKRRHGMQPA